MATMHPYDYAVIVESGDTLYSIADEFLGSGTKSAQLAAWNGLGNGGALIYPGQEIWLDNSNVKKVSVDKSKQAVLSEIQQSSVNANEVFVTWTWSQINYTKEYEVQWTYSTYENVEWDGDNQKIQVHETSAMEGLSRQSKFTVPSGAKIVWVRVRPISKEKSEADKKMSSTAYNEFYFGSGKNSQQSEAYFTASWSEKKKYYVGVEPPDTPTAPDVTLTDLTLKAELSNINLIEGLTRVEFQCVTNNIYLYNQVIVPINREFNYVSKTWNVLNDRTYKVRCRLYKSYAYSEWSQYSEVVTTQPLSPEEITVLKALSESSIYVEWSPVGTASEYAVEYTTNTDYFDSNSSQVTSITVDSKMTHTEILELESGKEYFFRVRAENNGGASEWTEIKSIIIGTTPSAPTTWSSTSTAVVGEPLNLYWVHNCEDNSKWNYADIRLYVNGVQQTDIPIKNESTDEEDSVGSYALDTSNYPEGTTIEWQVRTNGITLTFGEWSTPRTIDIYAQPTLELSVTDSNGGLVETLTSFPFYVRALAGPNTQAPLSYHVSVISDQIYETVDAIGNEKIVNEGDEIYSKHFDTNDNPLSTKLDAGNIDLENNMSYTVVCTVAMNSGLTVEARKSFTVLWEEIGYFPDASVLINYGSWTAQINPFCESSSENYHKVTYSNGVYTVTDEIVYGVCSTQDVDARTESGELVGYGVFDDSTEGYYCLVTSSQLIEGVTLGVYRKEFDGTFTEIMTGIENSRTTFITDPHPALDYARYRIVATTAATGTVSYHDIPAKSVGCSAIIVQWNEEWPTFISMDDSFPAAPVWGGSMVTLPYNVDVSDTNAPQVEMIEYAGRKNPTSYYGTHIGQTATWNTEIPKTDRDTLYALRRLAVWMGDVYVREPSGSGYWANVKVSFNQTHLELTIPVTLTITRVEGGV